MKKDHHNALVQVSRSLISADNRVLEDDWVVVEEPLQIRILWSDSGQDQNEILTITMRTPGQDEQLAAGLLISEGIIKSSEEIYRCYHETEADELLSNQISLELNPQQAIKLGSLNRRLVSHSSCGICGKTSLQELELKQPPVSIANKKFLDREIIFQLPAGLLKQQQYFHNSGGVHAAGLFSQQGELLNYAEDVGRHNALDKIIGSQLLSSKPANPNEILLTSGRASFELVQKTLMAGYSVLVAVGAPSSLAISAAKRFDLTLIGFVSETRCNVYTGEWRFIDSATP